MNTKNILSFDEFNGHQFAQMFNSQIERKKNKTVFAVVVVVETECAI